MFRRPVQYNSTHAGSMANTVPSLEVYHQKVFRKRRTRTRLTFDEGAYTVAFLDQLKRGQQKSIVFYLARFWVKPKHNTLSTCPHK